MNSDRWRDYHAGISALPPIASELMGISGSNGETLTYDEAEVWKRVLDWRIASFLQPSVIIETHAGKGVGTAILRDAAKDATIHSCQKFHDDLKEIPDGSADLVDIDPFGHPYEALYAVLPKLKDRSVVMVTNGEMMQVVRGLKKSQYLKTDYKGKQAKKWVDEVYIPFLEIRTKLKWQFYYIFPTTVRVILSSFPLPKVLFEGCPTYMWWFKEKSNLKEFIHDQRRTEKEAIVNDNK